MTSRPLKNSALILSSILFFACFSCGKKDHGAGAAFSRPPLTNDVQKDVKATAIEKDSVVTTSEQPKNTGEIAFKEDKKAEAPKIETVSSIVPETGLKPARKGAVVRAKEYRKEVKKILPTEEEEGLSRCYSLLGTAVTTEEARDCAQAHRARAMDLMAVNMDSAYLYCKKAISLYENGSLFTLKAQILVARGRFSEAVQAAECSIARHDHWDYYDRITAGKVRYDAYLALYKKYPSTAAMDNVNKAKADFEVLRSLGQQ
jgi:tetratricopeptide (TPR) repeat protein